MSTPTPNVIVQNPIVRKVAGNVLAVATLVLLLATVVDVNIPAIDYGFITTPATGIVAGFFSIFQLSVTSPNVPTYAVLAKSASKVSGADPGVQP